MPRLRISQVLSELAERTSRAKLLKEIENANGGQKSITARKLGAIIRGNVQTVSMSDLEAIDRFLRPLGQGLADRPLFDEDCLMRDLARTGEVTFFVPTRVVDHRDYTSVWDVRAFGAIAENMKLRWPTTQIKLREEVNRDFSRSPEGRDWSQLLHGAGTSYCCLGSPLATLLAEYMLSCMFGVTPFKTASAPDQPLPFYFVWYPPPADEANDRRIPIRFAVTADDLDATDGYSVKKDLPQAIRARHAQAFIVGEKVYEVRLDQHEHKDYAVVVAQRREKGEIWVVIAGLSGPGTFAAASELVKTSQTSDELISVPESKPGEVSAPVFAVVESVVKEDSSKTFGDNRIATDAMIVAGPEVWTS
jgi:hypothetical protein